MNGYLLIGEPVPELQLGFFFFGSTVFERLEDFSRILLFNRQPPTNYVIALKFVDLQKFVFTKQKGIN